jgi:phosphatidylglycerophosphate synthase
MSVIGYVLFRLHIIIDMSDGDVARFNKSFSIRGAYWDAVIHSIVNPLYYVFISYSFYHQFDNDFFMILGALAGVSSSILMAVKNNYYKAMLFNNETLKTKKENNLQNKSLKFKLFFLMSEFLSIEGFILLTILIRFLEIEFLGLILLLGYIGANLLIASIKFYQLSYTGSYQTKS